MASTYRTEVITHQTCYIFDVCGRPLFTNPATYITIWHHICTLLTCTTCKSHANHNEEAAGYNNELFYMMQ